MRRLNCYHISKHRVIHRIIAVLTVLTCGSSSSDRLLESSDSCSNLNDSFLWLLCCMLASNMCRNAFPHDCPRCVGSARDYAALLMVLMMCIEFRRTRRCDGWPQQNTMLDPHTCYSHCPPSSAGLRLLSMICIH